MSHPLNYLNPTSTLLEPAQGLGGAVNTLGYAWSATLLQPVKLGVDASGNLLVSGSGGGGGGSVTQGTVPWVVYVNTDTYSASSGAATSSGNNTIRTPSSGKSMRLFYVALSAPATNTTTVKCTVQFLSGSPLYTINLVPGAIYSRNIGAGKYYLAGAVNDSLIVNLDSSQTVNWSVEYLDA